MEEKGDSRNNPVQTHMWLSNFQQKCQGSSVWKGSSFSASAAKTLRYACTKKKWTLTLSLKYKQKYKMDHGT